MGERTQKHHPENCLPQMGGATLRAKKSRILHLCECPARVWEVQRALCSQISMREPRNIIQHIGLSLQGEMHDLVSTKKAGSGHD